MTTIKKYYIRKDSTNYGLISFNYSQNGTNNVDITTAEISKNYADIFTIGNDVAFGYLDGSDTFITEWCGDITNKEINETVVLSVESYGGRINRSELITAVYENKSPEYIIEDLIDNYVTSLTYSSANSTGITLSRFVLNSETVGEAIQRILRELDWQIRVTNSKEFYFEPKGTTPSSYILTVGTNAIAENKWTETPNQLINYVTVIGHNTNIDTSESFEASASQTEFEVSHKITGNIKVTVDGTEKVGGQEGSTSSYDYTVDREQKKITFESGMTGGEIVIIYYSYDFVVKVTHAEEDSVSTYSRFPKRVTNNSLKSMAQARDFAKQITKKYGSISKSNTLLIPWNVNINTGETVQVIDSFNNINSSFNIIKKTKQYPEGLHTIIVGVEEIDLITWSKSLNERIKNLEANQDNSDLLQEYKSFKENLNVVTRQGRVRTRTQNIYDRSYDTFILGHPTNGKLGTQTGVGGNSVVLGDHRGGWNVTAVSNPNNIMYERFNFDTYINTGSTTATINTSGEQCEFTTGEVVISLAVAKRTSDFGSATLTADSTTNLTFQMSADGGSHWENVTSGTAHTFTDDGNELRWKATASDTATLGEIKIEY